MGSLSNLSGEITAIVDRLAPSVVQVDAGRGRPATGIIWEASLVLTAEHVIADEAAIQVGAGRTLKATLVGRDPSTDLALLRVDGLSGAPAPRVASSGLRAGQVVLAVGNAGALQVTLGIVSGLGGEFRSWRGAEAQSLIQTTAELLPGFSGGPLVDAEGRVIGINSWHFGRGISRALPVDKAAAIVQSLREHGRIRRAYLGVGAQPIPLPDPKGRELGQEAGLLVVTVEGTGPAGKAGVLQGDIIVSIDGQPVHGLEDLFAALRGHQPGAIADLRMIRAGELQNVPVTLGERAS